MKVKRWLVSCTLVATAIGSAHAAIISDNTIGTLAGVVVHNFSLPVVGPPTAGPITGVLADATRLPGATYGESFDGQTVGDVGGFDVLTGTPNNPLKLLANSDDDENISWELDETIAGLLGGNSGEGALSVLLDVDTDVFGFNVVGADASPGSFTVMFFGASGNSLGSFNPTAANSFFGFRADAGERIRGVSITNTDPGGIGFDNVTFRVAPQGVPEPGTLALLGFGLAGLALARRRRS